MQRYGFDMLEAVSFRAHKYGEEIARLLAMHGNGEMEMPLIRPALGVGSARAALEGRSAVTLFPEGRAPEAALAGLYLYFGCWDEAHQHADAAETRENYYWHAIVHRQEPDAWNAGYWFRKTGSHAIFPALVKAARAAGYGRGPEWDPIAFIEYCAEARPASTNEASTNEGIARRVQLAEWQLLFDYCAAAEQGRESTN